MDRANVGWFRTATIREWIRWGERSAPLRLRYGNLKRCTRELGGVVKIIKV